MDVANVIVDAKGTAKGIAKGIIGSAKNELLNQPTQDESHPQGTP
jgi:hypothetical protein